MKKYLLLSLTASMLFVPDISAKSMYKQFNQLKGDVEFLVEEVQALKESNIALEKELLSEQQKRIELQKQLNSSSSSVMEDVDVSVLDDLRDEVDELAKNVNGNHLKLSADFRTSVDSLYYKMADGSIESNNAFLSNRLWLDAHWRANKHMTFSSQLAYSKAFGARSGIKSSGFEDFDWIVGENPYHSELHLRSAYFLYINDSFLGTDIPWTFSLGRRPSTNGSLINLRDDLKATNPLAHAINVEFDGMSTKFVLSRITDVEGMYVRLCVGRGLSNARERFSFAPYSTDDNQTKNIDLAGVIFVPYSNGQFTVESQIYTARNLIDVANPQNQSAGFKTVGNLYSETLSMKIDGIGDGLSDFTDFMLFFFSISMTQTDPQLNEKMLGSSRSELGYSIWSGVQFDSLISDTGRWGAEYNYGSRYWRSMTYGEDTLAGSKIAVRGSAYELYFTEPLVSRSFSMQLRLTYLDYSYAGSNGFFGDTTGTPYSMAEAVKGGFGAMTVDSAIDARLYLRYKF